MKNHIEPRRVGLTGLVAGLGFILILNPDTVRAAVNHGFLNSYTGTDTCLECHGEDGITENMAAQVMGTVHWTWQHTDAYSGQNLGKKNVINNYCIALPSNEPRCTSCHVGIGWRDNTFDFQNPSNVDCLVCHDTTGTYKKTPTGAGLPDPTVDLLNVARHVGKTSRATCGACHFYGGGGDAVKHGDLDSTMTNPLRTVDVHMGTDGANQNCSFCHEAGEHRMAGSRYSKGHPDSQMCGDCHTATPHQDAQIGGRLNSHTSRVACQSCHVPFTARGGKATKMSWDWSTAGQKAPNGSDIVTYDPNGNPIYDTKKGTFVWEANVVPEYVWFNGDVVYTTIDEVLNPAQIVTINKLQGNIDDPNARIVPVKRFTGVQPYDAVNGTLAVPHLFPLNATDTAAYWKGYNWVNALTAGMSAAGRTFGGTVGWIQTEMFWIQNHMVAPKEQALTCTDCHTPSGRIHFAAMGYEGDRAVELQNLAGFEIQLTMQASPPGVRLSWISTPRHVYQVQVSTNLNDPGNWTDVEGGHFVSGDEVSEMSWVGAPPAGEEVRFYRVQRRIQ